MKDGRGAMNRLLKSGWDDVSVNKSNELFTKKNYN
jgi:hypothetical protein